MNLKIITLFLFIDIAFTHKPRKQMNQRVISTIPKKVLKKSDVVAARYKMPRKVHHEPTVVKNLPFFPEVEYPTSIMEVSKPFYFSSPRSDCLFNEPKIMKPYQAVKAPRRDSRKAHSQDHSALSKLIDSLKRNATRNAVTKPSPPQDDIHIEQQTIENEINKSIEINEIPTTIPPIFNDEVFKNEEITALPETVDEDADNESEIEYIEYYCTDEYGSGDGGLEILDEKYFYVDNDSSSNDNDSSIEENDYSHIFVVDLLEGFNNYTEFIILEDSLITSDEINSKEILDCTESIHNVTEAFGILNSTNFVHSAIEYEIPQSEESTKIEKRTGNSNRPNPLTESIASKGNFSPTNDIRSFKMVRLPKNLLKSRGGRKWQRNKLLNKA